MMFLTHLPKLHILSTASETLDELLKGFFVQLFAEGDIQIDGHRPWDIQVHDPHFYRRIFLRGSLGLGESYMDKWWDVKSLDQFIFRIFKHQLPEKFHGILGAKALEALSRAVNLQTKRRSRVVAKKHYDLGNDLYRSMLDSRLVYSCGYWKNADSLEAAQRDKLALICDKLQLKKGMKLLDIGCGWGGLAKFAAEHYGVKVTGVTISKQQWKLAKKTCQGLPVTIELKDYRDIREKFDCVVSVGMFEHVGYKNYRVFMKKASDCLKDGGLFVLQTIGSNVSSYYIDEWIHKYIFPNSMLPSAKQISEAYEGIFVMEDWHNFGADYDKTLMAWNHNFKRNWSRLASKYGERFYRMWTYYLLSCAATFRARQNQLWQIVFSKEGAQGGYESAR